MDAEPREWLGIDELAARAGVSPTDIEVWHRLDLLTGDGSRFPLGDLERARLIDHAARRGVEPSLVAEACHTSGDLVGQFAEQIAGEGGPRRGHSIEEVAEASGLDPDTLHRIWVAAGLGDQTVAFADDVEVLRTVAVVLEAGLPEDALVQLIRVYADALGRVGEAENRLFHYYVHEQLRADGLQGEELTAATNAVSDSIVGLVEPTVLYFHRKAFQRALRDDFLLHLTEATTAPGGATGEMTATLLFVDLAGFTPLTESMGDDAAAKVIERFSAIVREAASAHSGRIVKQIGDEFMLAFTEPTEGILCGLDVLDAAAVESEFPGLRIGAHHGTLLYREGDYIGGTVNLAARVVGEAGRHQLLVTDATLGAAHLPSTVTATAIGPHELRGISGEILLHRISRGDADTRVVDPVCHMLLDEGSVQARRAWQDELWSFCSNECAERFAADPERYVK